MFRGEGEGEGEGVGVGEMKSLRPRESPSRGAIQAQIGSAKFCKEIGMSRRSLSVIIWDLSLTLPLQSGAGLSGVTGAKSPALDV